jgi:hypothetical protein
VTKTIDDETVKVPTDVKDIFIQGAKFNDRPVRVVTTDDGKRILEINEDGSDNKIDEIKVNGTPVTPTNKSVSLTIPGIRVNGSA